ncbi:unnamed protein product [Dimorphilus gyrociliatus]|uniref:Protein kinase domain-containing protein n=1 Tax=Dimorphilus gyrociliatus TaxID=2664684 RepID=A0A7I8V605_9ANNE|nr:unnamed protein product [Dimorphilus gyrociliatus]
MSDKYYSILIETVSWIIPGKFSNVQKLTCGAQGMCCTADDETIGKIVIKKLLKPFENETNAKRAWREIVILRHLSISPHPHIINLLDIYTSDTCLSSFNNVYLITEYGGQNLKQSLKNVQCYDQSSALKIIGQVVSALAYLHSGGILHRDLKPENISVSENLEVKLLDFGLSRTASDVMSGYVITRPYRAPEVICSWTHYKATVDIWSAGCILAELLSGKILFAGKHAVEHLQKIINFVGKPDESVLSKMTSADARNFIAKLPNPSPVSLEAHFTEVHESIIDLLRVMLTFDPDERISAKESLQHESFRLFRATAYISSNPFGCPILDCHYDREKKDLESWKSLAWNECNKINI